MPLNWDKSGQGEVPITLADVQEAALGLGYGKAGVAANKPLAARVNLGPFFDQYAVKAFSNFKKRFFTEPLRPIAPGGTPMAAVGAKESSEEVTVEEVKRVEVDPKDIPDVSEFDKLVADYPKLKWRVISRPGGATMKPTDFYRMNACVSQASNGDNTAEKPMWAAHGGLDFDGRENWDQWTKLKGMSKDDAKKELCRVWAEAHAVPKENFRMY